MPERAFHADAMTMLSWAADENGKLTFLSPSFERTLGDVYKGQLQVNQRQDSERLDVQCRMAGTEEDLSGIFCLIKWLFETQADFNESDEDPEPSPGVWLEDVKRHLVIPRSESSDAHPSEANTRHGLVLIHKEPWQPLNRRRFGNESKPEVETASARVIHPAGLRMRRGDVRNVYDLVFVARRGTKEFNGYQGMLQPAWERVQPIARANVRTASLRLISRSLSHNIGSHALSYLQSDLRHNARTGPTQEDSLDRDNHSALCGYLRERFEMMAGVSVEAPMSWGRATMAEVIDQFNDNRLLRTRICRSEGVQAIDVNYVGVDGSRDTHLAKTLNLGLPGDLIARHAILLMVENIVRDSAKHEAGPAASNRYLLLCVQISEPNAGDTLRLAKVTMWGQFEDPLPKDLERLEERRKTAERLRRLIKAGIICDHEGVPPKEWGTLERLVCACYLRGIRPEDHVPTIEKEATRIDESGMRRVGVRAPSGEPPLLEVEAGEYSLRWSFYMPLPRKPIRLRSRKMEADDNKAFDDIKVDEVPGEEGAIKGWAREVSRLLPRGTTECVLLLDVDRQQARQSLSRSRALLAPLPGLVAIANAPGPPDRESMFRQWMDERGLAAWRIVTAHGKNLAFDGESWSNEWIAHRLNDPPVSNGVPGGLVNRYLLMTHLAADRNTAWFRKYVRPPDWPADVLVPIEADFWNAPIDSTFEAHEGGNASRLRDHLRGVKDQSSAALLAAELTRAAAIRVLVADERIGARGGELDRADDSEPLSRRQRWALAGVDIMAIGSDISNDGGELLRRILDRLGRQGRRYDYVCIHLGILEKAAKRQGKTLWQVVDECENAGADPGGMRSARVIIHSGRTKPVPPESRPDFRFCQYGNLEAILVGPWGYCKLDLVRFADGLVASDGGRQ